MKMTVINATGKALCSLIVIIVVAQVNYCLQLQEPSLKSVTTVREVDMSNAKNVMELPDALNATELGLLHVHHVMDPVVII